MPDIAAIQQRLDTDAKDIVKEFGIPGIAGVIVRDNGSTVMHTVQGLRDTSKSATAASNKITRSDYFNVGSISKPITGFFIACLVKKGILTWATKISDVYPELKSKAFRDRCGFGETFINCTVYELMAHSSGLGGWYYFDEDNNDTRVRDTDPMRFISDQGITVGGFRRDKEWQNHDALRYLRYLYMILYMKKTKYTYNSTRNFKYLNKTGSGYTSASTICACMVEKLMNKPWETIITDLLANTAPMQMIYGKLPNGMQLHAYNEATGKYEPNPVFQNDFAAFNSKFMTGGMHCTVDGMAQYIKYNLEALNYSHIFDVVAYHKPVTEAAQGGLFLGYNANKEPLNHNGATGSSLADLDIWHKAGRGFAVMLNSGGGPEGAAATNAQSKMMQALKNIHNEWDTIT